MVKFVVAAPVVPNANPLVPALPELIIGESLADEARQGRLVDRFLDELEAQPVRSGTASAAESS